MKRILILAGAAILILFSAALFTLKHWMGKSIKANIHLAMERYPGEPEEALLSFLEDTSNSFNDRTHIAIWTLGQIRSEKALPVLQSLYRDDPEGNTCYGHHDSMLCQYEIHKALECIAGKQIFNYEKLKKAAPQGR